MPSPKRDFRRPLHASVKCDTCTMDADVLLASVMKENKIVLVCGAREGKRVGHRSLNVSPQAYTSISVHIQYAPY